MNNNNKEQHPILFELYKPIKEEWLYTKEYNKHFLSLNDIVMPIRITEMPISLKSKTYRGNSKVTFYVFGVDAEFTVPIGIGSTWECVIGDNLLSEQL